MTLIEYYTLELLGQLQSKKKGTEIQMYGLLYTDQDQRARTKMGGFMGLVPYSGLNPSIVTSTEHILLEDHQWEDYHRGACTR
jgi:hypothetical protein